VKKLKTVTNLEKQASYMNVRVSQPREEEKNASIIHNAIGGINIQNNQTGYKMIG
jgi:hypothetical protein